MKSYSDYLKESLSNIKLDAKQLFELASDAIDYKAFALNSKIDNDDAKNISALLHKDHIKIVSSDQMYDKYTKDDVDKIMDDIDSFVSLGVRYGSQIGASPEEKKERAEAEGKDISDDVDDSDFVAGVVTDFIGIEPNRIEEYFWKKSGTGGYLIFIIDATPEVEDLIKRL